MTAAVRAKGNWLLEVDTGAGTPSWSAIPEIRSVSGGGVTTDRIDVTNFSSAGSTREYIGGLADPQARSFTANFIPGNTVQHKLRDANSAGTTVNCRITLGTAAGTTEIGTFTALVSKYDDPTGDPAKELAISFELTPTGATTWAAGT